MKIAVWHNLPSGGGKRALYDHVRGLVSRGHEVEAWCPPTADRSYLPLAEIVPEHVLPLDPVPQSEAEPGGRTPLHRIRWNTWTRLQAMKRHSLECAKQMAGRKFDLLFAASCILYHTPVIGRYTDIPSVLYLQEPNRLLYEAQPELLWPAMAWAGTDLCKPSFWARALERRIQLSKAKFLAREERISALAFDEILVNSFFSRESVLRVFGINSEVCYLGVDTDRFVNQGKRRESFAVFVGAVLPSKNISFLIESLSKVQDSLRPKLVLVANTVDAAYLATIQGLAQGCGVVLELKHQISDSEVIDILNRARLMLYAPRLEPFGYAPLEACACGVPVVAVAEGGVRETIKDGVNGILVEHKPDKMAAAIERLMLDSDLHKGLSAHGQELAKTAWSLDAAIDRLEIRLQAHVKEHSCPTNDDIKVDSVPA